MPINKEIKVVSDVGSERACLAGVCQYGKDAQVDISDIITVDTFTSENNKAIFKCLNALLEETQSVDITSLIAKAEELHLSNLVCKEKLDVEFLRSLFNFPLKLENVRIHAGRIAKLELVRKAQSKHIEAYNSLKDITGSESVDNILAISERPIFDLITELGQTKGNNPVKFGDSSLERLQYLENNPCENIGIPTPYPRYNEVIGGGLRNGGVDILAARPKNGKSTFGLNVGLHTSLNLKIPTLYLDSEMDLSPQQDRIHANLASVHIKQIETGKFAKDKVQKDALYKAEKILHDAPFFHQSIASKKFDEVLSIIRRWIVKEVGYSGGKTNPCLIIYDYFKIMNIQDMENLQEHQAVGYQLSSLADFSKQYDFPCLSFAQLNRAGIDEDTSDIISQSDRLLWMCSSASFIRRKVSEEIMQDGDNGNIKLQTLECRFGPGLDLGNYINLQLDYGFFKIQELNTKFDISQIQSNTQQQVDF